MKLEVGMAVLPTVTSKSGKSSKTRKGSYDKDNHTEVAYILKLGDLTIYITSMFGCTGMVGGFSFSPF